jgi:hypothetical protein
MFSCAAEQAVNTPQTAIAKTATVNHLRETRFMIINLAIRCEVRQSSLMSTVEEVA